MCAETAPGFSPDSAKADKPIDMKEAAKKANEELAKEAEVLKQPYKVGDEVGIYQKYGKKESRHAGKIVEMSETGLYKVKADGKLYDVTATELSQDKLKYELEDIAVNELLDVVKSLEAVSDKGPVPDKEKDKMIDHISLVIDELVIGGSSEDEVKRIVRDVAINMAKVDAEFRDGIALSAIKKNFEARNAMLKSELTDADFEDGDITDLLVRMSDGVEDMADAIMAQEDLKAAKSGWNVMEAANDAMAQLQEEKIEAPPEDAVNLTNAISSLGATLSLGAQGVGRKYHKMIALAAKLRAEGKRADLTREQIDANHKKVAMLMAALDPENLVGIKAAPDAAEAQDSKESELNEDDAETIKTAAVESATPDENEKALKRFSADEGISGIVRDLEQRLANGDKLFAKSGQEIDIARVTKEIKSIGSYAERDDLNFDNTQLDHIMGRLGITSDYGLRDAVRQSIDAIKQSIGEKSNVDNAPESSNEATPEMSDDDIRNTQLYKEYKRNYENINTAGETVSEEDFNDILDKDLNSNLDQLSKAATLFAEDMALRKVKVGEKPREVQGEGEDQIDTIKTQAVESGVKANQPAEVSRMKKISDFLTSKAGSKEILANPKMSEAVKLDAKKYSEMKALADTKIGFKNMFQFLKIREARKYVEESDAIMAAAESLINQSESWTETTVSGADLNIDQSPDSSKEVTDESTRNSPMYQELKRVYQTIYTTEEEMSDVEFDAMLESDLASQDDNLKRVAALFEKDIDDGTVKFGVGNKESSNESSAESVVTTHEKVESQDITELGKEAEIPELPDSNIEIIDKRSEDELEELDIDNFDGNFDEEEVDETTTQIVDAVEGPDTRPRPQEFAGEVEREEDEDELEELDIDNFDEVVNDEQADAVTTDVEPKSKQPRKRKRRRSKKVRGAKNKEAARLEKLNTPEV